MAESQKSFTAYSPPISIELQLASDRYSIASLGPDTIALRDAKHSSPPARGMVRLVVDGHVTVYHVELPDGIDPKRDEQAYRVIESGDVAAVA